MSGSEQYYHNQKLEFLNETNQQNLIWQQERWGHNYIHPISSQQYQENHVDPFQQQMLSPQMIQTNDSSMNFPELLPVKISILIQIKLTSKCDKLDPFKYRIRKMEKKHDLTDKQYYQIEMLRIKMLNHVSKCSNSKCELVFKGHNEDPLFCVNCCENNPPFIRIGYNRGCYFQFLPLSHYLYCICPYIIICVCLCHFNNYDVSNCREAMILNDESMDLQIQKRSCYKCNHYLCCKYTGQRI